MTLEMNPTVIDIVDKWFATHSNATINLDRDNTDKYALTITPALIDKSVALHLIPNGNLWSPALNWRSFFGIPIPNAFGSIKWLTLGGETVVKHPNRGAYPVFRSYLFKFPISGEVIDALEALGNEVDTSKAIEENSQNINFANGLIRSVSKTPTQHQHLERWIIHYATKQYRKRIPFMFRTLLLNEQQLTNSKFPHPRLLNNPPDCMMCTVPQIEKTFSPAVLLNIKLTIQAHMSSE